MNRYEVFIKVVEAGSFTRAADTLGYSQSAVSQMVQTLEQELSTQLIERGKHGVVLTPDGQTYYPFIQNISVALQGLREKHRELLNLNQSVIRIGTFTSVSRNWLPQLMKAFRKLYPGVRFILEQGEYTSIAQWIKEGLVDFGFVVPEAVSGLEIVPLARDTMVAVLPPAHPLAQKDQVTLQELVQEPFILLDEGALSVPLRAFEQQGLEPDIRYKVYDDYTIIPMVQQGLGVSVLYQLVLRDSAPGVALRPLAVPIERTIALAWRDRRTLSIASRKFTDFILEQFTPVL
jgi:DNA-binding transcriptional LysR family regulator